jgi:hypothetical protein
MEERTDTMAHIIVPLNEAIHVLSANIDLGTAIQRIDATERGPKLVVGVPPLGRFFITIRFERFEGSTAWFTLDGLPTIVNLNAILRLPAGITASGSRLRIQTDTLLNTGLGVKGIAVRGFRWENGTYVIETAAV